MKPFSPHILVIDDDPDICELVQLMLLKSDPRYRVTSVLTSEEGLKLTSFHRFDLYVLDYRMSGINGIELCRILRSTDSITPILFFTGATGPRERVEAIRAGANSYLIKPDDLSNFTNTVKRLLVSQETLQARINKQQYRPDISI